MFSSSTSKRIRNLVLAIAASAAMAVGGTALNAKDASAQTVQTPSATCQYEGILQKQFVLLATWQQVPDGRIWWMHGGMHARLECDVKRADIQINIQRGKRAWNRSHTVWHWVWITRATRWEKLDGRKAGFAFHLQAVVPCTDLTNWRIRFWGSPGELSDGTIIQSTTIYYRRINGNAYDCRP